MRLTAPRPPHSKLVTMDIFPSSSRSPSKAKKRRREEEEEEEEEEAIEAESRDDAGDESLLSLEESLTFSDTMVALRIMRAQFPRIDKVSIQPFVLRSQLYSSVTDRTRVDREVECLRREKVLRVFKLSTGQDDHAIMFLEDYMAQIERVEKRMEEKKQGDLQVFQWFKQHVIDTKLEPSIDHQELVSLKITMPKVSLSLPLALVALPFGLPSPAGTCVSSFLRFPRFASPPPLFRRRLFATQTMGVSKDDATEKELPLGLDKSTEEEYAAQSKLLQEFTSIPSADKAWTFKSKNGSQAMFSVSQANLLANKRRKFIQIADILKESSESVNFQWAPFPVEMSGVSTIVPSPSGSKLLVVRNPENESPIQFEIWTQGQVEKEFHIPQSVHGSVYADGWFEGISWNSDETLIAYVAEEPSPSKPTFGGLGYKKGGSTDKECGNWKGQGEWVEDWGETYAGKRQPALFVIEITSGEVQPVKGIAKSLSVGQVVWAPSAESSSQYLVFVGWSSDPRKLGIKYCYNRACALYAVRAPLFKSGGIEVELKGSSIEDSTVLNLTQSISSAFFPVFSPDGKFLLFLSAKSSVDSGAHCATDSLHKLVWPVNGMLSLPAEIVDVIPVVQCAENGCFPGLYSSGFIKNPWLADGCTMILSSAWRSTQVILSVNVVSGEVSRITPADSNFSWNLLTLDGDNIIAVSSSPIDLPQIKYGYLREKGTKTAAWSWFDVSNPIFTCSEKVKSLLSSRQFDIFQIPVKDTSNCLTNGAGKPFEAIFVSSNSKKTDGCDPLIVVVHGGPHGVSVSSFLRSLAFLSSLGYSLLIVNYRGSLGFGEEALQSLPGKVGSQDVNDVLTAIDHVINMGLACPPRIAMLGGSHGGFLTTHLIGQAPDKFSAAAARNPVCNFASMVGITDIPDWCYFEAYGIEGKSKFTEAPSAEDLALFYSKSPIAHISKVKAPTIFLIGAQDLRVPMSNGLQYARALKEKGVETKTFIFPNDVHGLERPQSFFESFLNIGVWFKKYCK